MKPNMPLERFKEIFWNAFHRPKLESDRIQQVWLALEPVNDILAGPLFAIYEHGNCHYVFKKEELFHNILNADDLMDFFQALLKKYAEGLEHATPPTNDQELKDLQTLDYQLDLKAELCEIAYQLTLEQFEQKH
jgi:hypothetical protein